MGKRMRHIVELFPGSRNLQIQLLQPVSADENALALCLVDIGVRRVGLGKEIIPVIHSADSLRHRIVFQQSLGQRILFQQAFRNLRYEFLRDKLRDLLRIIEDIRREYLGQRTIGCRQL